MVEKSNKLTIYLIKEDRATFDQAVEPDLHVFPIDGIGTFYTEDSFVTTPEWVKGFFGAVLDGKFVFKTASSQGVLLARAKHGDIERIFAVVFGYGRHLLAVGAIEERFGLKVVLNSVDKDSLRSIDKTTLGSVPKQSREQMSREGGAASFGLDIEQDLVSAMTGRSKDSRLGKTVSGGDPLSVSVKVNLENVLGFLPVCLEKYLSDAYKANFDWIDQIKRVRDPAKNAELNDWLVERLKANDLDKVWMAPPSIMDWVDLKGFRYGAPKRGELQADMDAAAFVTSLKDKPISMETLKGKSVYASSEKNNEPTEQWTAYKCLFAEANIGGAVFVLNNGTWYQIAPDFTTQVLAEFDGMPESTIVVPTYNHEKEGAYNLALAASFVGSHCLDGNVIIHGGGHSSIEFCDVMTADKKLLHIKRYSGSAPLSHLFNQGVVSGELFLSAADFREKLNVKLPAHLQLADTSALPVASDFEIVFGIIMPPGKPLEIPFFSKVSLRNARRRLQAYGYSVTKKKIDSSPAAAA
jgi:uncharacterized protein (TIGR04141 family)